MVDYTAISTCGEILNDVIEQNNTWVAELPFPDIVGRDDPVDLFSLIGKGKKTHTKKCSSKPEVIFDPKKYPPNKEGMISLCNNIKSIGLNNGSSLTNNDRSNVLTCYRGRLFRKYVDKKNISNDESNNENSNEYDEFGVKCGVRNHSFHNNRKNCRPNGRSDVRASNTKKPLSRDCLCKVRLVFDFFKKDEPSGFIFFTN